ncbi:MAG: hybrid sensor histidine kinase/response regulator, partial [Bryobacteraceae bacterium]
KKAPPGEPFHSELAYILEAGERAAELTQGLLKFGRKKPPQPEVLDLNLVLPHLEALLRRLIGDRAELVMEFAPAPCRVAIDETQLTQVMINLIVNARDAMPDGGRVTVRTAMLHLNASVAPACIQLSVSDTGEGMDETTRIRIFEPYFTTKDDGKGTGLGLSVVHGIVNQSGGRIEVESIPGQGSMFRIFLPHAADTTLPPVVREPENVLVIDEDGDTRRLLRTLLQEAGYRVAEATDGEQAVRLQREHPADMVITDLAMPERKGIETIQSLRSEFPDLRIIAISGALAGSYPAIAHHLGAEAVFNKPLDLDALLSAVRGGQ